MSTNPDRFDDDSAPPPSDAIRAGEYVLGVLDAFERRHAQARIVSEPMFGRLVDEWETHFSAWTTNVTAEEPPAHLWPRIRNRLGWPAAEALRPGLWNNVGFWRGLAGLAAAAALATLFIGRPTAPPEPPSIGKEEAARPVTVLLRDDGSTGWIASIDLARGKLLMVPVPRSLADDGRVDELWIIPAGKSPLSLGFVSNEKAHTIAVPIGLQKELVAGATLAVTLEPQLGMPHAAPSGPIVAKGGILGI